MPHPDPQLFLFVWSKSTANYGTLLSVYYYVHKIIDHIAQTRNEASLTVSVIGQGVCIDCRTINRAILVIEWLEVIKHSKPGWAQYQESGPGYDLDLQTALACRAFSFKDNAGDEYNTALNSLEVCCVLSGNNHTDSDLQRLTVAMGSDSPTDASEREVAEFDVKDWPADKAAVVWRTGLAAEQHDGPSTAVSHYLTLRSGPVFSVLRETHGVVYRFESNFIRQGRISATTITGSSSLISAEQLGLMLNDALAGFLNGAVSKALYTQILQSARTSMAVNLYSSKLAAQRVFSLRCNRNLFISPFESLSFKQEDLKTYMASIQDCEHFVIPGTRSESHQP